MTDGLGAARVGAPVRKGRHRDRRCIGHWPCRGAQVPRSGGTGRDRRCRRGAGQVTSLQIREGSVAAVTPRATGDR